MADDRQTRRVFLQTTGATAGAASLGAALAAPAVHVSGDQTIRVGLSAAVVAAPERRSTRLPPILTPSWSLLETPFSIAPKHA